MISKALALSMILAVVLYAGQGAALAATGPAHGTSPGKKNGVRGSDFKKPDARISGKSDRRPTSTISGTETRNK
jgi:hypothetical protein